jgi:hypothetical protein
MTYFENSMNLAWCQGVGCKQARLEGFWQKAADSLGGLYRSYLCMVLLGKWLLFSFFFFFSLSPPSAPPPRALAVILHLYALGVQAIDLLGQLLSHRKAANQSRTLPCLPAANSWSSNKRELRGFWLSSQLQSKGALSRAKLGGAQLNPRSTTSWGLSLGSHTQP